LSGGLRDNLSAFRLEIAGVLRGAVNRQQLDASSTKSAQASVSRLLQASAVEAARSSASGEVFELRNALDDRTSIVIHVYGGTSDRSVAEPARQVKRRRAAIGLRQCEYAPTISFQFRTRSGIEETDPHRRECLCYEDRNIDLWLHLGSGRDFLEQNFGEGLQARVRAQRQAIGVGRPALISDDPTGDADHRVFFRVGFAALRSIAFRAERFLPSLA
jgi:hypothetical protein